MVFAREAKRHFLTAFSDKPGLFVEACICDSLTRAVSTSYIYDHLVIGLSIKDNVTIKF